MIGFALTLFVTDFVMFGFIAGDYFNTPFMRAEPDMPIMIAGYVVGGYIYVWAYVVWGRCANLSMGGSDSMSSTAKALWFGIGAALIIFPAGAFIYTSLYEGMELVPSIVQVGFRIFQFALAGLLVGKLTG